MANKNLVCYFVIIVIKISPQAEGSFWAVLIKRTANLKISELSKLQKTPPTFLDNSCDCFDIFCLGLLLRFFRHSSLAMILHIKSLAIIFNNFITRNLRMKAVRLACYRITMNFRKKDV